MKTTVNSSDFINAFRAHDGRFYQMGGYRSIQYTNRGQVVSLDDIQSVINEWEYHKRFNR